MIMQKGEQKKQNLYYLINKQASEKTYQTTKEVLN